MANTESARSRRPYFERDESVDRMTVPEVSVGTFGLTAKEKAAINRISGDWST